MDSILYYSANEEANGRRTVEAHKPTRTYCGSMDRGTLRGTNGQLNGWCFKFVLTHVTPWNILGKPYKIRTKILLFYSVWFFLYCCCCCCYYCCNIRSWSRHVCLSPVCWNYDRHLLELSPSIWPKTPTTLPHWRLLDNYIHMYVPMYVCTLYCIYICE